MKESAMLENAKDFAVNVIKVCNGINKGANAAVLTKQLIRSGTSVGANIHEAKYGYGSSDFTFKLQIALKECYESEYWIELLGRTGLITEESAKALAGECGRIRRMLISAINKMKSKEE